MSAILANKKFLGVSTRDLGSKPVYISLCASSAPPKKDAIGDNTKFVPSNYNINKGKYLEMKYSLQFYSSYTHTKEMGVWKSGCLSRSQVKKKNRNVSHTYG